MTHALTILNALDLRLNAPAELTLYGRAALQLGFRHPPAEYALSLDVDVVLWIGQAEELARTSNFWEAVEAVNREFADQELYISHFFDETQVILRPQWKSERAPVPGEWRKLKVYRLGDIDLFLTKLMRNDPIDQADARFIIDRAGLTPAQIAAALREARVPDISEIREQFAICSRPYLAP